MNILEKAFKIKENNTTIKTEIIAGLTTFFTMSYLFVISPKLLEQMGINFNVAITTTSLTIFICCLIMGFYANKPYAIAPFLGETAFIAYTLVGTQNQSIVTIFTAILITGFLLLIMSIFNIRNYIVNQIPECIKLSFCVGLGLFFIFISLKDMGIVNFTKNQTPIEMGDLISTKVIMSLFCLTLLLTLIKKKVKGAILIAIITTTIIGLLIGDIKLPTQIISIPEAPIIFNIDFSTTLTKSFIPTFFAIFLLANIDTAGALIGLEYKINNNNKRTEDLKRPMISDSIAVLLSPILGTTTSGAYLDSMTGIEAGGRTGLTAIIVGLLFFIGMFFSPIITIIPQYAYAPVLLYVGILLTSIIIKINFEDITEFAPAIFTISAMVFTCNIASGIMLSFIIYPLVKLLCNQKEQTNKILWLLFVISIIYFYINKNTL